MGLRDESKMLAVCGFYLASNMFALVMPVLGYLAYHGNWACRVLGAVVLLDYALPLKTPQLWLWWSGITDDSVGKSAYFRAKVVLEGEFRNDRNYLVCYHPHSLFGIGYNLYTRQLYDRYGIKPLFTGASVVKYLPLLRRVLTWWGFTSVSADEMRRNLRQPYPHNVLTLMPGGIAEMFYGIDEEQIILRKRKGFCKLALETGASLVPCYCMGANQVYTRYFGPRSLLARISSVIRVSLLIWTDRFGIPFGVVPNKVKMLVVLGEPIEVEAVAKPTPQQVEELHARYTQSLKAMFDRHKGTLGPEWAARQLYLEDEALPRRTSRAAVGRGKRRS